jgi:hypothetical protein
VFRPARPSDPANPLRYLSTLKAAIALFVLAALVTLVVFPLRNLEANFEAVALEARANGVPQLPPAYATPEELQEFFEEWNIACSFTSESGLPPCGYFAELSEQRGQYEDDASLMYAGLMSGLLASLVVAAFAFSRALNNLDALGRRPSHIPQAWAFASFLIPLLNLVLPWKIVDEVWRAAWSKGEGWERGLDGGRPSVVVALWGIAVAVTAFLNPVMVTWVFSRSDIDGWVRQSEWMERALIWLPAFVIFTALLLAVITWRQRRRIRELATSARMRRIAGTSAM